MKRLPSSWTVANVKVSDASAIEANELRLAFNELDYLERLDPAFESVNLSEMVQLLKNGTAGLDGIQLQAVRERESVVGYYHVMHAFRDEATIFISMFFIRPSYQNHSLGKTVAKALLDHISSSGYSRVWLKVSLLNWRAIRFWVALGFRKIVDVPGDKVFEGENYSSLVLELNVR